MANFFGPVPPPIPYASRSQLNTPRRPSRPSLDASLASLTRKNAVYYPNYRCYRGETPATLNYNCISHVFYAFAHLSADGGIFLSDEWADAQMPVDGATGCLGSFMRLKEQHSYLKLILSIGGGAASQHFASVASSAASRDNFGRSAKGLIDASGFDGIDIDWEHPSDAQQGADFLALLAAIRLHLPNHRYILTAALPAGQWALQHIDLNRAQDYLDLINLMAYDFAGSWSTTAGHHAQLHPGNPGEPSGSAAVDYVISTGFPASKILLGVPVYGRSFLGASAPGHAFNGCGGEEGTFEYKQLPRNNAEEIVNTRVVAAFSTGADGGFVSYDNPETVKIKAGFCLEKGLGGLFYWTGTADAPPGPRSLIGAGFKALHGG
ncbi:probable chitinase 1 precursor [Rhynchosporium agropyri]|uniref:chitinase n=3 Tax=Rhynchosporium TaxID=38037 RepID=A0A1E1MDW7_RHYSE|nr:probable chitinase 1 precursor [Rhynchosporium commune]CZT09413.1 probable chitinase 1 precursor [Rhynchosporium agropyri]CZT46905.1 probable chitinase 1 precursor [Rhynchosporium secalis]